ncbi:MAG: tRNA pseudouridine(55) synthase TruB [Erysipelotrichales bacterium]|nr:tRNA pseudouridine(55) synthase TruB [Erysipelotrichales bacterium]
MDGILLVNKPAGVTSRDVVNKLSKKLGVKKIGHVGTLDPFATGLLVVVVGKATKIAPFLEKVDKNYIATLKLGVKTDTLDLDGKVIETHDVPELDKETITTVLKSFVGKLEQVPPMFSAIKCNGVPLYKLARNNIEVERKIRTIEIYKVRLISFKGDEIRFSVSCSKGTYIRTFGEQIAEKLGTVGHLIQLKRTKVGNFDLKDAHNPNNIMVSHLIGCVDALSHMDIVSVDEKTANDIKNGKTIELKNHEQQVLFVDEYNNALAVYEKINDNIYKCVRGLF